MKILCPYCDFPNIEGVDVCDQCGQDIVDVHLTGPKNAVELGLLKDRLSVLNPKPPVTVKVTDTVGGVLKVLTDHAIGCVFVANDQGKVVGVFSERDALMRVGESTEQHWDSPIGEFMTPNPEGLKSNAKIAFAVHQMDHGHYRHIPIIDDEGRAQGVVSVRDILQYLTEKSAGKTNG